MSRKKLHVIQTKLQPTLSDKTGHNVINQFQLSAKQNILLIFAFDISRNPNAQNGQKESGVQWTAHQMPVR